MAKIVKPVKSSKSGKMKSATKLGTKPASASLAERRQAMRKDMRAGAARQPDAVIPPAVTRTPLDPKGAAAKANLSANTSKTKAGKLAKKSSPNGTTALARPLANRSRQMTQSDMVMPKLRLGQAMSDVVKAGTVPINHYYMTGRNMDLGDVVYIIPVDWFKTRSIFKQGQGVLCRSFDMVQGQGNPGILCEGDEDEINDPEIREEDRGCAFRLWSQDEATGRRVPPPCQVAHNYPCLLVIPDEDGEWSKAQTFPVMFTIRSTSTAAAKQINTAVMSVDEPLWYENLFEIGVGQKTNSYGTFGTVTAQWFGTAPDHLQEKARAYARLAGQADFVRANLEDSDDE